MYTGHQPGEPKAYDDDKTESTWPVQTHLVDNAVKTRPHVLTQLDEIIDQFQFNVDREIVGLVSNTPDKGLGAFFAKEMYLWPEVNAMLNTSWYKRGIDTIIPATSPCMYVFRFAWFYCLSIYHEEFCNYLTLLLPEDKYPLDATFSNAHLDPVLNSPLKIRWFRDANEVITLYESEKRRTPQDWINIFTTLVKEVQDRFAGKQVEAYRLDKALIRLFDTTVKCLQGFGAEKNYQDYGFQEGNKFYSAPLEPKHINLNEEQKNDLLLLRKFVHDVCYRICYVHNKSFNNHNRTVLRVVDLYYERFCRNFYDEYKHRGSHFISTLRLKEFEEKTDRFNEYFKPFLWDDDQEKQIAKLLLDLDDVKMNVEQRMHQLVLDSKARVLSFESFIVLLSCHKSFLELLNTTQGPPNWFFAHITRLLETKTILGLVLTVIAFMSARAKQPRVFQRSLKKQFMILSSYLKGLKLVFADFPQDACNVFFLYSIVHGINIKYDTYVLECELFLTACSHSYDPPSGTSAAYKEICEKHAVRVAAHINDIAEQLETS